MKPFAAQRTAYRGFYQSRKAPDLFFGTDVRFAPDGPVSTSDITAEIATSAVYMTVGGLVGWHRQTLDGSFSAVSKPIFASNTNFAEFFEIYKIIIPLLKNAEK